MNLRETLAKELYESYWTRGGLATPCDWEDLHPRDSRRADFYLDADAVLALFDRRPDLRRCLMKLGG